MKNPDVDPFVEALRGDLPSVEDEARVRARLLAAGVALTSAAFTASSATAMSGATAAMGGATGAGSLASPVGAAASGTIAVPGAASAGASAGAAGLGASAGGSLAAGAPAALVKAGLMSKVLLLPVAAKIGVATTLAVAVAATSVPFVLDRNDVGKDERAVAARTSERAPEPVLEPTRARAAVTKEPMPSRESEAATPSNVGVPATVARAAAARASEADDAALRRGSSLRSGARTEPASRAPATSARASRTPKSGASIDGTETNGVPAHQRVAKASPARARTEGGRTELVRASSLGEETRLMEQAMGALGEGDRALARRSLEEHAQRFPDGLLERERERALARLRQAEAEQSATDPSR